MKKAFSIIPLLMCAAVTNASAQTIQSYRFQQSLAPSGPGSNLTEVLSCGAATAPYESQTVTTSGGQCGAGQQIVRTFNEGGGFSHLNGFITGTYTIDIFFKFNSLGGYRRVIDFMNGTTDEGLYINNSCLNFYSTGISGTCPFFLPNTYYLITLVRDGATNTVDVYVNGSLFVNGYDDASGLYAPATTSTPIVLFRDNISSSYQCEDGAGAIRYFSVSNARSTAADVAATYANICAIALSQEHVDFGARMQDGTALLEWRAEGRNDGTARYDVQHSSDGESWQQIGTVSISKAKHASYSFTDLNPTTGSNYYRLRIVNHDGSESFSNTVALKAARQTAGWTLAANPASSAIVLVHAGVATETAVSLFNIHGQRIWQGRTNDGRISIPCDGFPAGTYVAICKGAAAQQTLRVVVQH